MTFITLLEAAIIIYLAVYNIRIIRKMDRLKKQLRSSPPDKPNLKETLDTPLPVIQETEPENKNTEPKADGETKVTDSTKDKKLFERINRTIIEEQLFSTRNFQGRSLSGSDSSIRIKWRSCFSNTPIPISTAISTACVWNMLRS